MTKNETGDVGTDFSIRLGKVRKLSDPDRGLNRTLDIA